MLRVEFDRKLFTHNEMKRWYNGPRNRGWAVYAGYKKALEKYIKNGICDSSQAIILGLGPPRVKKTVKVLYITKRLQDEDNFYASLKPLLDALVDLEVIKDDSADWCKLIANQRSDWDEAYKVIIEVV